MAIQNVRQKIKKIPLIRIDRSRHMFISPPGILSFPHLFTPNAVEANQEPSFSCDIIFDDESAFKQPYVGKKTSTPSIRRAIHNVRCDQWGTDAQAWPNFAFKCEKNGNDKVYKDEQGNETDEVMQGYADKKYLTLRTGQKYPPRLFNIDGTPAAPEDLYGGAIVRVQVLCRPYITPLACGVSLRLLAVMKVDDGVPFGLHGDVFDFESRDNDSVFDTNNMEEDDFSHIKF